MNLILWPAYAAPIALVPTPWTCADEGAAEPARRSHRKIVSLNPFFSCTSSVMWLAASPKECSCQGKGWAGTGTTGLSFSASATGLSHLSNYNLRFPGTPLLPDFPEKHAVSKSCRCMRLHLVTTDPIALYFPCLVLSGAGSLL